MSKNAEVLTFINVGNWKKCLAHCEKLRADDVIKEGLRDEILIHILMTINLLPR